MSRDERVLWLMALLAAWLWGMICSDWQHYRKNKK